ncbi:hypothetical protein LMB66_03930 [Limosilactobacillus reuteri]|uniref:hypothetical protein n=1 Tax=Limosilactobacillus reuteri TaxID=1598 RepID=UPI001E393A9C|nr:hypothetical protein [Limosilactobacillus reuteri]MCC4374641.1 hypothetical protein [Limosilactobacillus reuteri]
MDTETIIEAINSIDDLHNDDQFIAYSEQDFLDFVNEQIQEQFEGDKEEAMEYTSDWFEILDKIKKQHEQPQIIVELYGGEGRGDGFFLLSGLNLTIIKDYTSSNNISQRLELLRLKEEFDKT